MSLRPGGDAHWLEHFYLAPHLQGNGIGAAVLRRLLSQCDRDGTLVRLNVLQGSPARRLYERHGFTHESEDPVDVFMVRKPVRRSGTAPAHRPPTRVCLPEAEARRPEWLPHRHIPPAAGRQR